MTWTGWMTTRFRAVPGARGEPWIEVRGSRTERLAAAVEHVGRLLASPVRAR